MPAALAPYHRLLKREIEAFGGTVEKFIGDSVMAVFGAPIAHEDDAERAVRAALRITEAIEELNEEANGFGGRWARVVEKDCYATVSQHSTRLRYDGGRWGGRKKEKGSGLPWSTETSACC